MTRDRSKFWMVLGVVVLIMSSAASSQGEVKSALGESCVSTADCISGLVCANSKCVGKLDAAKSCARTADCPRGLRCIDNKCIAKQIYGAWVDPVSGLTWQNPPAQKMYDWKDAKAYCSHLELGGYSDWRLPTISELRSLIRRCSANQTGGSCRVTDTCLSSNLCDENCHACEAKEERYYWPDEMEKAGNDTWQFFWSSSPVEDRVYNVWLVGFIGGIVYNGSVDDPSSVRCVR